MVNRIYAALAAILIMCVSLNAQPADHGLYVVTGACYRYIGPMDAGYGSYVSRMPMGSLDEYIQVSVAPSRASHGPSRCPRENGVPKCS